MHGSMSVYFVCADRKTCTLCYPVLLHSRLELLDHAPDTQGMLLYDDAHSSPARHCWARPCIAAIVGSSRLT